MVYLAAMLHDIGKPDCQIYDTKDGKINMHYYGHHKRRMEIVKNEIIPELLAKDYCYSDTIMTKEDFEEFKRYINQF